jgi:hypothetical protein
MIFCDAYGSENIFEGFANMLKVFAKRLIYLVLLLNGPPRYFHIFLGIDQNTIQIKDIQFSHVRCGLS